MDSDNAGQGTKSERLAQLADLRRQGVLSDEEYEAAASRLLEGAGSSKRGRRPIVIGGAVATLLVAVLLVAVILANGSTDAGRNADAAQVAAAAASAEKADVFRTGVLNKWAGFGPDLSLATDAQLSEVGAFVCSRPLQPYTTDLYAPGFDGVALTAADLPALEDMIIEVDPSKDYWGLGLEVSAMAVDVYCPEKNPNS